MTTITTTASTTIDAKLIKNALETIFTGEIAKRGGEIDLGGRDGHRHPVKLVNVADGLGVMRTAGWRKYTKREGHHASTAYLCGYEDGQVWAVRIPGTITTVADALVWITPVAVKTAVEKGKRVMRQGDVYAVETTKAHDGKGDLPARHVFSSETRYLTHPEHPSVHLPYPVRFVPQKALGMGRGWGTSSVYAD